MFKRVLVPIDLSDEPNQRLAVSGVKGLCAQAALAVKLVTVLPGGDTFMAEYIEEEIFARATADATKELEKVAEEVGASSTVTVAVRHGNVYDEVLQEAQAWGADLIVMGSHRPQMSTYFFGSNAARIVRHAPCSVLVLRTARHSASR